MSVRFEGHRRQRFTAPLHQSLHCQLVILTDVERRVDMAAIVDGQGVDMATIHPTAPNAYPVPDFI